MQNIHKTECHLFFGYLIPKHKLTMPLDIEHISIIGFKHGLMLIH